MQASFDGAGLYQSHTYIGWALDSQYGAANKMAVVQTQAQCANAWQRLVDADAGAGNLRNLAAPANMAGTTGCTMSSAGIAFTSANNVDMVTGCV